MLVGPVQVGMEAGHLWGMTLWWSNLDTMDCTGTTTGSTCRMGTSKGGVVFANASGFGMGPNSKAPIGAPDTYIRYGFWSPLSSETPSLRTRDSHGVTRCIVTSP